LLSIIYGILSACVWGAGDFVGGIASKRASPIRVLYLAEVAGFVPFLAFALITHEAMPPLIDIFWSSIASLFGLAGLAILYRALADGKMTITAPVSGLLAALIPVAFGFFTLSMPTLTTLCGFGLACLAVWFISQSDSANWRVAFADLRLPLLSGFFFGSYFILLNHATQHAFFWTLAFARLAGFIVLAIYALATRQPAMPPREVWGYAVLNGILDIGGNALYVLSAQTGRMDVAAVLSALYPASTVFLAWILLKERISRTQAIGIVLAFIAIVLFTI